MKSWLAVVGIGEDGLAGLAPAGRALVETAQVLVGGARHLGMVPEGGAERLLWERPLDRTIAAIAGRRGRSVTVLASGDPLWYGIGVTLASRFSREEMTIVPQPTRPPALQKCQVHRPSALPASKADVIAITKRKPRSTGPVPCTFFVRCDRSTMTQNDLDNGRLVCLIGVVPLRPAEFVIFRIGQWTAEAEVLPRGV